jgi:RNA polymerase sigma-70 factor (ECF subfamily)
LDPDIELVEQAQKGNIDAFKKLVTKHKRNVYNLAFDLTRHKEDAEDVSQDVFIRAFSSIKKFRRDAKFSSWIYRITVNTCLSLKNRKSYTAVKTAESIEDIINTNFEMISPGKNDPEKHTEAGFIRRDIEKALWKLTARERTIFIMRNYSEMRFNEIAEIIGIKPGTVRSINFDALEKIRKELAFYKEKI